MQAGWVPSATYRVQLHAGFDFDQAAAIAPYLADLGVSHMYCSPYLQAVTGSTHGYDVVDHSRVNAELGGTDGLERLRKALADNGLSQVVDLVPNHMAATFENPMWCDVLANGAASRFACFFDVDWGPPESRASHRVLLAVLDDHYGQALEAGDLAVAREPGGVVVRHKGRTVAPIGGPSLSDEEIDEANANPEALDRVLERQHYRLAFWRAASEELDYRRFFDVVSLVGLRVEDEEIFAASHRLLLDLVAAGTVTGLRVDHPDGLADPAAYLRRLAASGAWIVVEKILGPFEELPASWPVAGTTGYDFLNVVNGLFVDPDGETPMSEAYVRFAEGSVDFGELAHGRKLAALRQLFVPDLHRIADLVLRVSRANPATRDFTPADVSDCVAETVACLGVYRTYVRPGDDPSAADVAQVETAAEKGRARRPDLHEVFSLVVDLLLLRVADPVPAAEIARRFQQLTGAVTAKGVEDCALYRFNRLVSLNEVGGDPGRFGCSVEDFHRHNQRTVERRPETMLATSTHDTKRSDDVRARMSLLSEIPAEWAAAVQRWTKINERHRLDGLPDRNSEYLLYQTLVGAHPIDVDRVVAYMEKASLEGKEHTSWTDPDPRYDEALGSFVRSVACDSAFLADLSSFVSPLVQPGRVSSLAQTILKLTSPGVPDVYQGSELWDLSLVDPDNRRPVDYDARRSLLAKVRDLDATEVLTLADEGAPKLWLTAKVLAFRGRHPEAFDGSGSYQPLEAEGDQSGRVVAFARAERVAVVAPRLVLGLSRAGGWGDTALHLPAGRWTDVFGGGTYGGEAVELATLLERFPVALMEREP